MFSVCLQSVSVLGCVCVQNDNKLRCTTITAASDHHHQHRQVLDILEEVGRQARQVRGDEIARWENVQYILLVISERHF